MQTHGARCCHRQSEMEARRVSVLQLLVNETFLQAKRHCVCVAFYQLLNRKTLVVQQQGPYKRTESKSAEFPRVLPILAILVSNRYFWMQSNLELGTFFL